MDYYSYYYYQFIFCWLWKSYSTNKLINSCINIASETTPHSLSNDINHVKKFFFLSGFSFTDTDDSQDSRGREGTIFYSTLPLPPAHEHSDIFATLHVRWLSRIFNRNACVYQTATQWDLPPYRITIWLIDNGKLVDSSSHQLSPLYYKRTDSPSVLSLIRWNNYLQIIQKIKKYLGVLGLL